MWHGGQNSDMLVTVQDMLRLVKVARLELSGAGRNARARLTVQRMADTGVLLQKKFYADRQYVDIQRCLDCFVTNAPAGCSTVC
jgi:hypothetical protein